MAAGGRGWGRVASAGPGGASPRMGGGKGGRGASSRGASAHAAASRPAPAGVEGAAAEGAGGGRAAPQPDPLTNPLRSVLTGFMCTPCGRFDPEGVSESGVIGEGAFLCRRCAEGRGPRAERCAYTSVMYGEAPQYVCGALALGQSLRATGTPHGRVLLHTRDVPEEARGLLEEFWELREVDYIVSAQDLHTAPYDKARFKEVFTKLQIFDPELLPYDRVVFLDLDMLVLKNIDELFQLRPPAAMWNMKFRGGRANAPPEHGERMDPCSTYINAGTMVVAPSAWLHDLMARDVQEPDPEWHRPAWSPEQNYLSSVLAGEWSHVSQLYNLEVQLHSGVPLSHVWETAEATDVAVAHFSGAVKVWDLAPDAEVSAVGSDWVRQVFASLPQRARTTATVRCQALHAEWHRVLALALRRCRERGLGPLVGRRWAAFLETGSLRCWQEAPQAPLAAPLPGELLLVREAGKRPGARLCSVVQTGADGALVVWSTPWPHADRPFCAGAFGLCHSLSAEEASCVERRENGGPHSGDEEEAALGSKVVVWTGEGHRLCTVAALRGGARLLRFGARHAPMLTRVEDILALPASDREPLQCLWCLECRPGCFDASGFWRCTACGGPSDPKASLNCSAGAERH